MDTGCRMPEEGWRQGPADLRGIRLRGDEGKLRQALINLLGNAVKFTEQGEVRLRVGPAGGGRWSVVRSPQSGVRGPWSLVPGPTTRFRFEVSDTGPGIAPELQARLFRPFQQGESAAGKGGTGLGLAITRRLAEVMHGEVGVESRLGQGSRFWIKVPLEVAEPDGGRESGTDRGPAPESIPARTRRLASGVTVRALVVDDVPENRDILSAMLRQMGCTVEVAAGGLAAIARVKREAPDIVFLDVRMPGMDGMETLGRLRAELETHGALQGPRFVAVSASVLGHERDRCLASGFDAFLGKPFLVNELVALLERLLEVPWVVVESEVAEPGPLTVPAALWGRLVSSARGYRVTELKQGLVELEQLGPAGAALAARLRRLAQVSQMSEVTQWLEAVRPASFAEGTAPAGPNAGPAPVTSVALDAKETAP